jgi:hypothetical protein
MYISFRLGRCLSLSVPPLIALGFNPSEELLDLGFSLRHEGGEGGCGKGEKQWGGTRQNM